LAFAGGIVASVLAIVVGVLAAFASSAQNSERQSSPGCSDWRECQRLTVEALARGDFETSHDLAWRAVQMGPPHDPSLMYLLARTQAQSGRAHDALVMLDRLAQLGITTDAATREEFRAVRALPGWPQLEARLVTSAAVASPSAPSPSGSPLSVVPRPLPGKLRKSAARSDNERPSIPVPDASASEAAKGPAVSAVPAIPASRSQEVLRLTGLAFQAKGFAYDQVSGRFVVGDSAGKKLVVLDERSHLAADLVRGSSAGFADIDGLEVDSRRGDLWVVSSQSSPAGATGSVTSLHRLQLVSGRPLSTYALADEFGPARLRDVAVTQAGTVFVLDAIGGRIFRLQPHTKTLALVATLTGDRPSSLATVDDRQLYVAFADGIVHVDVSTGLSLVLRSPAGVDMSGIERLRWNRHALIGIQKGKNGQRQLVSLKPGEGRVTHWETLEASLPIADPTAMTISGDDFYFLAGETDTIRDLVVKRLHLP
jgi:hypothetical protein